MRGQRLTVAEKERLAELVAAKTPFSVICELIGRDRWTTRRNINYLKHRPAPEPKRSPLRLSLTEREEISRGLAAGESMRSIARRLGRAPSTVSREIAANHGLGRYRAVVADRAALRRMRRPKPAKLALNHRLRDVVEAKLELRWSPEQISGWLSVTCSRRSGDAGVARDDLSVALRAVPGALRKELTRYLRRGQVNRRPRGHSTYNGQGKLNGMVNISERPAEVDDRAVPGHWEGDLIFGKGMKAVATLVERQSRFLMMIGLQDGHTADVVADALAAKIAELPEQLRRSLTWDQGSEMAHHAKFSVETGVPVYFCDPAQPVAARHQREHQWSAASVLPETPAAAARPGRPRRRRRRAQRATSTNARMEDTIRGTRPGVALTA